MTCARVHSAEHRAHIMIYVALSRVDPCCTVACSLSTCTRARAKSRTQSQDAGSQICRVSHTQYIQVNRFKIVDYQSHYHYHSQAHAFDHGRADDVTTTRLSRRRIDRREGSFVPTVMKGKTEKLKNLGQKVDLYLHL